MTNADDKPEQNTQPPSHMFDGDIPAALALSTVLPQEDMRKVGSLLMEVAELRTENTRLRSGLATLCAGYADPGSNDDCEDLRLQLERLLDGKEVCAP